MLLGERHLLTNGVAIKKTIEKHTNISGQAEAINLGVVSPHYLKCLFALTKQSYLRTRVGFTDTTAAYRLMHEANSQLQPNSEKFYFGQMLRFTCLTSTRCKRHETSVTAVAHTD